MDKDCASCHEKDGDSMSLTFKRTGDMSAKQLQDVYHQNCIGCHADMAKAGQDTGPLESECRSCHNPKPDMVAKRQPINMDKSLHFRHISSKKSLFHSRTKIVALVT